jgi:DNA-binding response OmpR family regulator
MLMRRAYHLDGAAVAIYRNGMSTSGNKPRVYIIDDEERIVHIFGKSFQNGWDVDTESDPLKARDRLLSPVEYDAIILDVIMANLNGVNLYLELERRAPNRCKRIVYITGNADPLEQWFLDHGLLWIEKPFIDGRMKKLHAFVEMMALSDLPRGP